MSNRFVGDFEDVVGAAFEFNDKIPASPTTGDKQQRGVVVFELVR